MQYRIARAAAALATLLAIPALAEDQPAGAAKAAICAACHGPTGLSSSPEWPNLAGQQEQYLAEQLVLFRAQVRANPVMQAQAQALNAADDKDVSHFYASQTPTGLEADPSLWAAGQTLYRAGDADRGIPACFACHGPDGRGNGPARWPALRAQRSVYVYAQLKAYAAKTRYTPVAGKPAPPDQAAMMQSIASRMSDDEMKAVASYVQGLR
jgi:cytochrome c553